jgi:hypothetical protein
MTRASLARIFVGARLVSNSGIILSQPPTDIGPIEKLVGQRRPAFTVL